MENKLNELDKIWEQSISIRDAARILNKSEQYIRIGLQTKRLPFGVAVKMSSQWSYYISPKLFYEFTGYKNETGDH